jgi:adenosylcobinamide-phosphate synthase
MLTLNICVLVILFDILFGEPPNILHPTVWMGKLISALEKSVYVKEGIPARIAGGVLVAFVIFFAGAFGIFAEDGLKKLFTEPWTEIIIAMTASMTIGFRSLLGHARPVLKSLVRFRTIKARKDLSMIVGRETEKLDRSQISCATIETLAENLGDSIIAPLFFFAIFGLPGAFIYRAANTMDAMLGYKNEKYHDFGWAAAKFDDLLNYLPCRFCALPCLFLTAALYGRFSEAFKCAFKFHGVHASPNSGWYESTAAGALDVRLGGEAFYHGKKVDRPFFNPEGKKPSPKDIIRASKFVAMAAITAAVGLDIIITAIKLSIQKFGG